MKYDVNSDWNKVYGDIVDECCDLFCKKLGDYGPTWLYFRDISLIDTLWIKIKRVRTLEENGDVTAVGEGREGEFIGIINYAAVVLMKRRFGDIFFDADHYVSNPDAAENMSVDTVMKYFRAVLDEVCELCRRKNHDYGAAWVEMDGKSITDQVIIRVLRIKSFLKGGAPAHSEGEDAQLMDIINYSIFGLIKARGIRF